MVFSPILVKLISHRYWIDDLFARNQNHEERRHMSLSLVFVFQVSCSMALSFKGKPDEFVQ